MGVSDAMSIFKPSSKWCSVGSSAAVWGSKCQYTAGAEGVTAMMVSECGPTLMSRTWPAYAKEGERGRCRA